MVSYLHDDEAKESVNFNSKSQINNLIIVFQYYGFDEVSYFAVVSKADSSRVNIELSNIIGIP